MTKIAITGSNGRMGQALIEAVKLNPNQREMVPVLARAAVAVGVSGIFMETHPNPSIAKSDGLNSMPMNQISSLLKTLKEIDKITKNNGFLEDSLND